MRATGTFLATILLLPPGGGRAEPQVSDLVAADAKLAEVHADDRMFFEGPTWDTKTQRLYFTAFRDDNVQQILRLDEPGKVTVWADGTEGVNGTFLARDGRLLAAQAYGHRVLAYSIGADGPAAVDVLYHNPTLHQPNDLTQTRGGDIYFTDPDFKNRRASAVYWMNFKGKVERAITDMDLPNGVVVSPDGRQLYVSDSFLKLWRVYPLARDGSVGRGRVFFNPDTPNQDDPDGMTVDARGNVYLTGRGGVWIVSPKGQQLGFIPVPVFCSNLCFGGAELTTLYLTCSKKVFSLAMRTRGIALFHPPRDD